MFAETAKYLHVVSYMYNSQVLVIVGTQKECCC